MIDNLMSWTTVYAASCRQERQFLAALDGLSHCLPKVAASFQNSTIAMLVYSDSYQCDLALALSNGAVTDEAKPYYAACIFSAVSTLHENGLIHRFINSGTIFITTTGVPKVC